MPIHKLRQDNVRTLPYLGEKKQQCIYWDATLQGFGTRVYPTGRRVYVCSYRIHRRKRLAKLGSVNVLTLDQARKKAVAYMGKVANNEDPQMAPEESRKLLRIEELCELYIECHAKKKKKTWKTDESVLRRFVLSKLKGRLATSILTADLDGRQSHYFRREALYELVWTAPVLETAPRLGVSDVALAKLCRRAHIPIPGRGYWARLEAGQSLVRTPLPPAPEGLPELLRIRGRVPTSSPIMDAIPALASA